jgi:hypothetical protein
VDWEERPPRSWTMKRGRGPTWPRRRPGAFEATLGERGHATRDNVAARKTGAATPGRCQRGASGRSRAATVPSCQGTLVSSGPCRRIRRRRWIDAKDLLGQAVDHSEGP